MQQPQPGFDLVTCRCEEYRLSQCYWNVLRKVFVPSHSKISYSYKKTPCASVSVCCLYFVIHFYCSLPGLLRAVNTITRFRFFDMLTITDYRVSLSRADILSMFTDDGKGRTFAHPLTRDGKLPFLGLQLSSQASHVCKIHSPGVQMIFFFCLNCLYTPILGNLPLLCCV